MCPKHWFCCIFLVVLFTVVGLFISCQNVEVQDPQRHYFGLNGSHWYLVWSGVLFYQPHGNPTSYYRQHSGISRDGFLLGYCAGTGCVLCEKTKAASVAKRNLRATRRFFRHFATLHSGFCLTKRNLTIAALIIWYNVKMLVKLNTFSLLGIDAVTVEVTVIVPAEFMI